MAAARTKKTRRERDFRGLFLSDISSSVPICNEGIGLGQDAVNQTSLSFFFLIVKEKRGKRKLFELSLIVKQR